MTRAGSPHGVPVQRRGSPDVDVLVVGAGPTGLTLACDLRRRGLTVRVVERLPQPELKSRGKGVQPRTLEVLDDLGVVDRVLEAGWSRDLRVRWYVQRELLLDLRLPGRDPLPDTPHPNLVLIPQWRTEQVLRERLVELGGAVEWGRELVGLEQDGDGVLASVATSPDGAVATIRAGWVVGCDGGHSRVRDLLGLALQGESREERFLFGDVEVDGLEPADSGYVWFDGGEYLAASPFRGLRAWQVQASLPAGTQEPGSLELLQRLFTERSGLPDVRLSAPTWLSTWHSNVRLVDRYRVGRVFVAGDAAHLHSPVGGQGMNTGIQDAYNLGWKLALVVRGRAPDRLLDTYEEERRPIAAAVLSGSDLGYRAVFGADPVTTFLREHVLTPALRLPAVQRAILGGVSELDLHYRESSLVEEHGTPLTATRWSPGHDDERADAVDRLRFARGVRAGDRAPDGVLEDAATGRSTRLSDAFRGPHATLLLFDGEARTDDGYASLATIADGVERLSGADVRPWVVVWGRRLPAELVGRRVLLDPEGGTHRRYGATAEALYLVRPDGYVGLRAQPASEEVLLRYLRRVLAGVGADVPHPGSASPTGRSR
ncbi:FAD-dependent monooxygenase [Geodermatophilus poikilotrophus]|uniref:2-polyprenyl-6-methoxyphenol hydroxylase n=1 Tax=Geodermatophilus poikilotrophus TaxID=1333667 RepID=A0A1I0E6L4_9ACTN|nr:FAD-dependent monooxygenase [Geodermatophilus poikilotrophus]SET40688.1 2-polyprenyl-6-methoxyphenol hydroxylase [Geodermatophilus poikilotrophus]